MAAAQGIRKGLVFGLAAAVVAAVAMADGQVDTSFGTNGSAKINFPSSTLEALSAARLQANSSFLAGGLERQPDGDNESRKLFIATVAANGSVTGTPLTQDISASFPGTRGGASSVSIPADGKLLTAGGSQNGSSLFFAIIARFNADGSADGTPFNRTPSTNNESFCDYATGESPTGKVIALCVVGSSTSRTVLRTAVIRLNNDLTPDASFGSGGTAIISALPAGYTESDGGQGGNKGGRGIAKDASGNYYVLSSARSDFTCGSQADDSCNEVLFVAKLDSNGAPVNSFGGNNNGIAVLPVSSSNPSQTVNTVNNVAGNDILLDSNNNILVGGRTNSQNGSTPFVLRLTPNGALDPGFAGIASVSGNGGFGFEVLSLFVTSDGIYALTDQNLYRLSSFGTVDTSFNTSASSAYTLNNKISSDTSTWRGFLPIDTSTALLLGGVSADCVGVNQCGNSGTLTSPDQAIVAKVQLKNDTTPAAFAFNDQTNVALNSAVTSNAVTITGINAPANINVSGGAGSAYSIGCDLNSFTSNNGTISNGQTVCVRHTSSSNGSTTVNTTLTVGGVSDVFSSTTQALDTTPDDFQFTALSNQALNSLVPSNAVTITGINAGASISVSGAAGSAYSIGCDGNSFTSVSGTINNNQTVCVRHTSSASTNTLTRTTLNIGGVSRNFDVTTRNFDTTPNQFTFVDVSNAATRAVVISGHIDVTGIDAGQNGTAITITAGGSYSINGADFTASPGTVQLNDTVRARLTSSDNASTPVSATVTIGGVSDTFTVTTGTADTTPAQFNFSDQMDVAPSTIIISDGIIVQGINAATAISVTGGEYRIGSGNYETAPGSVNNGDRVEVRHTTSANSNSRTDTTLSIGGLSDTFSSTTAPDTSPNQFNFVDQVDVQRNATITSAAVFITGIDGPAPISVANGTYSIGCLANGYTSQASTIGNSQSVCVRHTSAPGFSAAVNTVLTVGDKSDTFTSTTGAQDTTPNAYSFASQTNTARGAAITSNEITVDGVNDFTQINVSGGSYSVNGGSFQTAASMVTQGDLVRVQHTSSASDNTDTLTTLSIGGVMATFTSTTGDGTPATFSFTDQTNVGRSSVRTSTPAITITGITIATPISVTGGSYNINGGAFTTVAGTVSNGQSVSVQHTASASFSTATDTVLTVGGVSDTFTSTTEAQDNTPDAYSFASQANTAKGVAITSAAAPITGINDATAISVSNGGSYSINNAAFTSAAGTITSGQSVRVQHTSSTADNTATTSTLTIGGVMASFTSTTGDGTPDQFGFASQNGVPRNATVTSGPATIAGLSIATPISVSGGSYSIGEGAFTTAAGTISNGQTVRVQHSSASGFQANTTTTLNIGGVTGSFTSTTSAADIEPNAFNFVDQTNVALNTVITSAAITIAGIDAPSPISITGGSYSVNGAAFTTASGNVSNGDSLRVQHTSANANNTAVNTVLSVGGVSDTFTSTTGDATPNSFSFTDQTGVDTASAITSNAVTVSGITLPVPISVTGGSYSIGDAAFTTAAGMVSNGQAVRVQHSSANAFSTPVNTVLSIGGVSDTFTSTTASGMTVQGSNSQTVTVITRQGTLTSLTAVATPAAAPADVTYPLGFFNYRISGLPTTGTPATVTVVFILPAGVVVDSYVKCNGSSCSRLAGASVSGNRLTLSITDNGPADSNPAQGIIDDPGAPAVANQVSMTVESGGAFGAFNLLLALPGLLWLRRRKAQAAQV